VDHLDSPQMSTGLQTDISEGEWLAYVKSAMLIGVVSK
jgi:hypothetical protein